MSNRIFIIFDHYNVLNLAKWSFVHDFCQLKRQLENSCISYSKTLSIITFHEIPTWNIGFSNVCYLYNNPHSNSVGGDLKIAFLYLWGGGNHLNPVSPFSKAMFKTRKPPIYILSTTLSVVNTCQLILTNWREIFALSFNSLIVNI